MFFLRFSFAFFILGLLDLKSMNSIIYCFISFLSLFHYLGAQPAIYTVEKGHVSFTSEAPLEVIKANSKQLRGAMNLDENTFAFVVSTRSFEGFNSPLQKEHFNEKYLESDLYPNTTFTGKIIEKIDFSTPGEYKLRAKGTFYRSWYSSGKDYSQYIDHRKKENVYHLFFFGVIG